MRAEDFGVVMAQIYRDVAINQMIATTEENCFGFDPNE
jgi:hypothetical protein